MNEFKEFPKIPRLKRGVVVTEKIDGTNACVVIGPDGEISAQSRSKIITPGKSTDNYGFAAWVQDHKDELLTLGEGYHYGEWWGVGIQRNYGLYERRFSLFNAGRWSAERPACCGVVPILCAGEDLEGFSVVDKALDILRTEGSKAAPGWMKPEGVVAYHCQSRSLFKALLENDDVPKGART